MPLRFRLNGRDKQILESTDLAFLYKLVRVMKNPKTKFNEVEFVTKGEDYLFNYVNKNVGGVDEGRRNFLKGILIGVAVTTVAGIVPGLRVLIPPVQSVSGFPKTLILDSSGNPIKASTLPVNSPIIMVFPYPLQNEINFLLNLGDENGNPVEVPPTTVVVPQTGDKYQFPGGVGPNKSIVAYSAICQHLGCTPPYIHFYPPKYVNISQVTAPEPNKLTVQAVQAAKSAKVPAIIHCDCHGSTYDPYHGAAVLTGPTVRPLPTVVLEWDSSTDYLYAVGAVGVPTYPMSSNGVPSNDPSADLDESQFGAGVGDKTEISETNPFSS
ncbi:MAG: Rieske 2Fe-2S domain-containing protein [Sulfolobaceae archaeon]|nr:Rieske 2Fe-2S domain-containing protein [Sulfolobales archaeon]